MKALKRLELIGCLNDTGVDSDNYKEMMHMAEKTWVNHVEWIVLMGTIISGFYVLDGKIDRQANILDAKIDAQAARTDRLYEMFIDLVKETRKG